jgi:hypothetical protein
VRLISAGVIAVLFACGDNFARPAALPVALHVRPVGADRAVAVNIGITLALEALPIDADSTVVGAAVIASWRSSDTSVANVSNQGVLQSHCTGTTTTVLATAFIAAGPLAGTLPVMVGSTGPRCAP